MRPNVYTPLLKRTAPINALQDPSTVTGGDRYASGFDTTTRPLGWADGRPYIGHKGVDYEVATGTPIFAPCDASIWTTSDNTNGNRMVLTVGTRKMGLSHLSGFARKGIAKKGDLIAYSGNTGKSSGPHLHVDVFSTSGVCLDALPYSMGLWGLDGSKAVQSAPTAVYVDTDQYEYTLKTPLRYKVDTVSGQALNVRERPGADKALKGSIEDGEIIGVDRRCDLPNGELWGRLEGQPWHWVQVFNGAKWQVDDAPPPAREYALTPGKVYQAVEPIQGYSEPLWSGAYRDIAFKGSPILVVERHDTADGLIFGKTKAGIWYLLFSAKEGWNVRGGWNADDQAFRLVNGTDSRTGTYTELIDLEGVLVSPGGNTLEVRR